MKKSYRYFILALLLIGFTAGSSFAAVPIAKTIEGEVLVVMNAPTGAYSAMSTSAYALALEAQAESLAQRKSMSMVCSYATLSQSSGTSIAFFKAEGKTTAQLIEELKDDPEVLSVSANYRRTINDVPKQAYALTDDPLIHKQWGLNRINIFEAWDNYGIKSGQLVYVAVIDTGVDYNHIDLRDNIARDNSGRVIGRSFYGNGTLTDNDPIGKNKEIAHGTHVAGIIGAVGNNRTGIAGVHHQNVKILPINIFTGDGPLDGCWDADLIRGLNYVLEQKRNGFNIRVVNLSLGGWSPPDTQSKNALQLTLEQLSDEGVIIVMSAGNSGYDIPVAGLGQLYPFPASFWMIKNKITVGSLNPVDNDKSYFSNYDGGGEDEYRPDDVRFVDMAAPGEYILSTVAGNKYEYYSGTSMAAPFVSGAVAFLCSFFPEKSAGEIKNSILNNTFTGRGERDPITGDGGYWANGSLNVGKAYLQFDSNPATPIIPSPTLDEQRPIIFEITGEDGKSSVIVDKKLQLFAYPDYPGHWRSRNNSLATVNGDGLLSGLSIGKAEIIYTPISARGVVAASKVITILDIYHEGSGGCSAGVVSILIIPFALFIYMNIRRRK